MTKRYLWMATLTVLLVAHAFVLSTAHLGQRVLRAKTHEFSSFAAYQDNRHDDARGHHLLALSKTLLRYSTGSSILLTICTVTSAVVIVFLLTSLCYCLPSRNEEKTDITTGVASKETMPKGNLGSRRTTYILASLAGIISIHFLISMGSWVALAVRHPRLYRTPEVFYRYFHPGPSLILFVFSMLALVMALKRHRLALLAVIVVITLSVAACWYDVTNDRFQSVRSGLIRGRVIDRDEYYCTWWWY